MRFPEAPISFLTRKRRKHLWHTGGATGPRVREQAHALLRKETPSNVQARHRVPSFTGHGRGRSPATGVALLGENPALDVIFPEPLQRTFLLPLGPCF